MPLLHTALNKTDKLGAESKLQ